MSMREIKISLYEDYIVQHTFQLPNTYLRSKSMYSCTYLYVGIFPFDSLSVVIHTWTITSTVKDKKNSWT
jgi:hypothetical protein